MESFMNIVRKSIVAAIVLLAAEFAPAFAQNTRPTVIVPDQPLQGSTVLIGIVLSDGPGFLVLRSQTAEGRVGPVVGWTAVHGGRNRSLVVTVDPSKVTPVLYAVLHIDAGIPGVFEFPGADAPVTVAGTVVNASFKLLAVGPKKQPFDD